MNIVNTVIVTKEQQEVLKRARDTYGFHKQVSVVSEELSELAIVCDKYQRYDSDSEAIQALYSKAVEETADVLVVLHHLFEIFQMQPADLAYWAMLKVDRLERWMNNSNRSETSMEDRQLGVIGSSFSPCEGCRNVGDFDNLKPGGICISCALNGWSNYSPKDCPLNAIKFPEEGLNEAE